MNLLDLMVKIGLDDKATEKISAISGDVKNKLASAAKVGAAALAATAAAAGAVGKQALDSYASYEQLSGGVEKLFGDSADQLKQYAQEAYKTSGMSANQYMEQATGFSAALINSLGGDTEEAAHLADVAMRSMSDNVNVFGSDMASVQMAFQGFAKQNYTMLDNLKLGYGGTKEEMERLIADAAAATDAQEALGLAVDANSMSFDNIVKAIDVVQYKQNIWGTTSKEAATTIEGSINMTKAAWQNFLTELGKDDADVGARFTELMDSATVALLGAVDENGEKVSEGILGRIRIIIQNITDTLPEILPKLNAAISDIVKALVPLIVELMPVLVDASLTLFMALLDGLAKASPQISEGIVQLLFKLGELIVQYAPQMLQAAWMLMLGILEGIANGIAPAMEKINELGQGILDSIGAFFGNMFQAGIDLIQNIKDGAAQTGASMGKFFGDFIQNGLKAVLGFLGSMLDAGRNLWDNLKSGAAAIGNTIASTFSGWIQSGLSNILGFVGSMLSAGASLISNLLSGATSIGSTIASTFTGWISSAVSQIRGYVSTFFNAGASILGGFIDGIRSGFDRAVGAVSEGLENIRSYLPFSPAKKGPFSGRGWTLYSGMSLMEGLADGIEAASSTAERSMLGAIADVHDAMGDYTAAVSMPVSASYGRTGSDAVIAWLSENLGDIIADYTPIMSRRDFDRMARGAVA